MSMITANIEEAAAHIGAAMMQRDRVEDRVILDHLCGAHEQLRGVSAASRQQHNAVAALVSRCEHLLSSQDLPAAVADQLRADANKCCDAFGLWPITKES